MNTIELGPCPFYTGQGLWSNKTGVAYMVRSIVWCHSKFIDDPPVKFIELIAIGSGKRLQVYYPAALRYWSEGIITPFVFSECHEIGFPEGVSAEIMRLHGYDRVLRKS